MLAYGEKDEEDGQTVYYLWRFMIDKRYQGLGFGRGAMSKAIELIKTFPQGQAEHVVLSYEPEN